MDELVKVLDKQGKETGEVIEKLKAHKEGVCHGISIVAIINNEGKVLLQRRALVKRDLPGKWDVSAAGHISAEDTPEEAAIRETMEEIGVAVTKDELIPIGEYLYENIGVDKKIRHYSYLYVVKKDVDEKNIVMEESEVDQVKYVDKKELNQMIENEEMVGAMNLCLKILEYMK